MLNSEFRERETITNLILYYLFKEIIITPIFYTYFRGKIYGIENVPRKNPLIIVSNHASYFDPPILGGGVGRPVAFMAKQELFDIPFLRKGIQLYGAYPVKRSLGDRGAIRAALNALKEGWIAGIFLEGTRTIDGRIHKPKLGAAMIAAKAQLPLLPVCLWGTHEILPKGARIPISVPVTLRIGTIIDPPTSTKRPELEAVTQKCAIAINEMHDLGR
ncbi:lysophospholipid acyltransferase family protein [Cyanobacterium sp. uoEpiScrs1]|uniref:lysophospholipid acyltransferase family protein n=1 Tax=Cyanobacterium sp. uoEpiScrs1 TaxID=2976343 RepID=UPI002269B4C4|nr:lysophospholipid acyltransferase family protein [Cyanobacterium sp. uoEpiScrs1]